MASICATDDCVLVPAIDECEAVQAARALAKERGEPVVLFAEDGEWLVSNTGSVNPNYKMTPSDKSAWR